MKPAVTYPDPERVTVDLLASMLDAYEPDVTVGVALPGDWNVDSSQPHVQVVCDGTPRLEHPVVVWPTVRLVAWARTTSRAKALVMLAQGLLCSHTGGADIAAIHPLTGVLPARDTDRRAELASATVSVALRSVPIE